MKSIVVDDFFEDPYSIIDFAKKLNYYPRSSDQYYEGIRTPDLKNIDADFYNYVLTKIVYNYFDSRYDYKIDGHMNFHRLCDNDSTDPQWINDKVHKDYSITSTVIYLTPDAPMSSGTQIYREVEGYYCPDIIFHNKFNRMITFPGPLPHSAMDIKGGREDRLTLLFFLLHLEKIDKNS